MGNAASQESRFSPRLVLLVLGVGAAIAGLLGFWFLREIGLDTALGWVEAAWEQLQSAPPIVFFGVMAVLTVFPVPLSPFYIVAGPLFGVLPSLLWIPPAIVVNNLIAHALTTSFLRPRLVSIVERRGHTIPTFKSTKEQNFFIAIVRITPGVPYFLQSIVLGLAGVGRWRFILISLPFHMVYVVGFVVLGRSAFDGNYGVAVAAFALIIVASVVARFAHQRMKQEPNPKESDSSN